MSTAPRSPVWDVAVGSRVPQPRRAHGFRRIAVPLVILVVTVTGIWALRELTQNRPDAVVEGTSTTIEFDVATRDYSRGDDDAAAALWALCSATVAGQVTSPVPSLNGYSVSIVPALGAHGENRLVGCLEDATLDRVLGDVSSIAHLPA
jgi:hypothetical protein